jgi:hypothetical protein
MWHLASVIDDSTHLWIATSPPTRTYCGVTARAAMGRRGSRPCLGCVRVFGADIAAQFPGIAWRRSTHGRLRHAFDPATSFTDRGDLWPVCHHYSFRPERLVADDLTMRCPGCVRWLQLRTDTVIPVSV